MKSPSEPSDNQSILRDAIIKLLYEEAPNTPWLSDGFYDKLLSLIECEFKARLSDSEANLQIAREALEKLRDCDVASGFASSVDLPLTATHETKDLVDEALSKLSPQSHE
jgi:hypothetical protein